jgi:AraC-like DNA-binding protein
MIDPGPDAKVYPIVKVSTIVELLGEEGVQAQDALSQTDIPASSLTSPAAKVSLRQVLQCCGNALRLTTNPQFAYLAGLRFHVSAYGMYGFAMLASTDFRQTMAFIQQYHQLATPLAAISFEERQGRAAWTIAPLGHPLVDAGLYRYLTELHCGIFLSILRDLMGGSFAPEEVRLIYGRANDSAAYPAHAGYPVLFRQPANQLAFDAAWLDRPAVLGNQITYAAVVKLCDNLLKELELQAGVAGRVRQAILIGGVAHAHFDQVARDLAISPRTLRRRLKEEGAPFRKLLDELRAEMAIKYLRETLLPVEQIGDMLGFTETANFRRAFHRWTKAAPRDYRDLLRA